MKNLKTFKIVFLILSIAGVLFSGYLSSVKLFSKTCAFGETCPLFLGMPACYFGFVLFFILLILSILLIFIKNKFKKISKLILATSFLGVIFAGYFSIEELPLLFENGFSAYKFGLPTCIMGCIFFIIIFLISIIFNYKIKKLEIFNISK